MRARERRPLLRSRARVAAAILALTLVAGVPACRKAAAQSDEVLPGRSRPLLEHGWAHPRDLRFGDNTFAPADARRALVVTPSGLRAYVVPADDRLVQMTAALPLGRAFEQPDEAGAADLLANLLARQLRERLGAEFTGRVQIDQEVDLTWISLQTLNDDWQHALAALIDTVHQPRLDPRIIDAYRTGPGYVRQTRGLGGAAFRPAVELARLVGGYPLAPPDPGRAVRREAVAGLVARSVHPEAIVLGIGGGVSRADAERRLHELTAGVRSRFSTTRTADTGRPIENRDLTPGPLLIDEPGFTTWIALGHPMPPIAPEHEAAVAVMTEILNIRLNIAIREMRGLANQAVLYVPATTRHGGLLHVRTGGRPESVAPLIHCSLQELSRIRESDGLPSPDELAQVQGGLVLGQWQRSLDGARAASATYATEAARHGSLERLTGWPEAVSAVTAERVSAAAQKYLHPDRIQTVLIGQLDAVRQARHPRWPMTLDQVLGGPIN